MFSLKSLVVLAGLAISGITAGPCKASFLSALGDETSITASTDDTPTTTSTLSITESSTTTSETATTSTTAPQSPANHGRAEFTLEYSNGFQCGTSFKPSQMIVAVHGSWCGNGAGCGRIMRVTGPRGTADVAVFDLCPWCTANDLDLSMAGFQAVVGDLETGGANVDWRWV
ncbi:hypothetical protein QQX98_001994 [Neonectria punicea]|uniref:RlpA-like protein double-psi beta-barrel domain-containing protein n=1 Tax=Neonectria punicea TaxID=979145 RepID=A0ABR1HKX4_9HYPO